VCRCWAAGAERTHGHEQVVLECDVPSNGTRRRSCGGKLLREMRERDGRIEDAAQVFDEMPIRVVLENARVLLLDEAVKENAAEGTALIQVDHGPREGEGVSMTWRIGKRSREAKAVVGRDELGEDAVQLGTTSSLRLSGSRGGSNATRV
jgi:hypothetical protein